MSMRTRPYVLTYYFIYPNGLLNLHSWLLKVYISCRSYYIDLKAIIYAFFHSLRVDLQVGCDVFDVFCYIVFVYNSSHTFVYS